MAEAGRIEDLRKIIEDIRSCGEGLQEERTAREEEAKSPGTSAMMEHVDLLKRRLKHTEEDRQRQIMINKNLKSKMEETTVFLKNNISTIFSDYDLFYDKLAANKKSAQTNALKSSELKEKVAIMADILKQQTNTNDGRHAKLKSLEDERDVLVGLVQQSPGTSALMEHVDLLKRRLKDTEEDRQRQIMINTNLKSKMEETTVFLKNNISIILSDYDLFYDKLAANKKSAQSNALKSSELKEKVAIMADILKQQTNTNDGRHAKLKSLEDERDVLVGLVQQSPGTSAMMEHVDLLKRRLKHTEEDRQRQIMINKNLKSKMEETTVFLKNNISTIFSDYDLFYDKLAANKKSAQTNALKSSELKEKVAIMADILKQQTNTNDGRHAKLKSLEDERDVLVGLVQQSPDTSALVEQLELLKRQLKVAEEKRKQQVMMQKNLNSKLEETTVRLQNNYDTILSHFDFYHKELAASKKSAQTAALEVSELEQQAAVIADILRQQANTADDLHTKIKSLEEERDMLLGQMSNPVKKTTSRSEAKSFSKFLLPVQRSRLETTNLPVGDNTGIVAEVTPVKKQAKKKTRGSKLKSLFCCCFMN